MKRLEAAEAAEAIIQPCGAVDEGEGYENQMIVVEQEEEQKERSSGYSEKESGEDENEMDIKKSGYTPIKNRESFIQRKIRMLNEHDEVYQRTSLENLKVRPVMS